MVLRSTGQVILGFLRWFASPRQVAIAWIAATFIAALAGDTRTPRFTIVDRGKCLVRTIVNTPGLNTHGDFAIWHSLSPESMQGIIYHNQRTITFGGDKEFSLVYPADINDKLTVVGTMQVPQDLRFTHAFEWSDNGLTTLPALGGSYAVGNAINSSGDAVGNAQVASGARHAVLWRGSEPRDLGLLEQGDYSSARDINDNGDIVGEANLAANGKPHAFLWQAGKMQLLGDLAGATFCSAQALNNRGDIVGSCDLPNRASHGVMWRNRVAEDLGTLGDDDAPSTALDINSQRQVVGSSEVVDGKLKAFLWEKGKMLDLNTFIPPKSGWVLMVASRINDRGEIAGRGFFHGAIHAFVLEPSQVARKQ